FWRVRFVHHCFSGFGHGAVAGGCRCSITSVVSFATGLDAGLRRGSDNWIDLGLSGSVSHLDACGTSSTVALFRSQAETRQGFDRSLRRAFGFGGFVAAAALSLQAIRGFRWRIQTTVIAIHDCDCRRSCVSFSAGGVSGGALWGPGKGVAVSILSNYRNRISGFNYYHVHWKKPASSFEREQDWAPV